MRCDGASIQLRHMNLSTKICRALFLSGSEQRGQKEEKTVIFWTSRPIFELKEHSGPFPASTLHKVQVDIRSDYGTPEATTFTMREMPVTCSERTKKRNCYVCEKNGFICWECLAPIQGVNTETKYSESSTFWLWGRRLATQHILPCHRSSTWGKPKQGGFSHIRSE